MTKQRNITVLYYHVISLHATKKWISSVVKSILFCSTHFRRHYYHSLPKQNSRLFQLLHCLLIRLLVRADKRMHVHAVRQFRE